MFRGLTAVSMDAKGRISIPSRYRKSLDHDHSGLMVVTIDTEDRCLLLYPYTGWEQIEQKLEALPSFHPASRRIQRLLIGHATEVEVDNSNRVLVPPLLREYAGLGPTILLVGQGKKFEIWGESQWHMARNAWLGEGLEYRESDDLPPELRTLSL